MVRLDTYNNPGLCKSKWISLDCDGVFSDKSKAQRIFDGAQMAFALGNSVDLFVDDRSQHNGWCVAYRIDIATDELARSVNAPLHLAAITLFCSFFGAILAILHPIPAGAGVIAGPGFESTKERFSEILAASQG